MMRCAWKREYRNVLAYFSKRDDGKTPDLFWAEGDVERCELHKDMRIRPYARGLSVVAVELMEGA